MSQKTVYLKSLLMALLMLPFAAMAQYTPLADQLTAVSDELYNKGDENYILVDAVRDGIITPDKRYSFNYDWGHFTFNEQRIDKSTEAVYAAKIKKFLDANNGGHDMSIIMNDNKISMKDILDEKSTFRNKTLTFGNREDFLKKNEDIVKRHQEISKKQQEIGRKQTEYTNKIIDAMLEDGLLSKKKPMHIRWNLKGVFVNDKKLKGELAEKYNDMFEKEVGVKLLKPDDGVEITRNSSMSITKASD